MPGFVVDRATLYPRPADANDTARTWVTIDPEAGSEHLEQRVTSFAPGRARPRGPGPEREEALFVLAGSGAAIVDGTYHRLGPETAVYIAAAERYEIENPGPEALELVSVSGPAEPPAPGTGPRRVTVSLAEQEAHDATTEREFRYLVHPGIGCPSMTQFVGYIPTVKAPVHYHRYDELVYVLEGRGVVHIGDSEAPMGPGTCIHLPPGQPHCLENTGTEPMRVLGVFRPAGDPSAAYEA